MADGPISKAVAECAATVISNEEIIARHRVVVCRAPEIASLAQPGHFVNVAASGSLYSILRKPFSIFRADPARGEIALLYRVHGATTLGMARRSPGDILDMVGPLGGRVFSADACTEAVHVLIGGGYGVPPLVFLAERLRAANPACEVRFIVGARSQELLLCEAQIAGLGIEPDMTTEDGSYGIRGRVTDALADVLRGGTPVRVYTCGPHSMMRAVAQICVAGGIPCQVSLETPMPCGIGVCMGCVVDSSDGRRARTCIEGPVFQAEEVVW